MAKLLLGWQDYLVFAAMLLLSLGIGVFFAIKDRKNKHGVEGYLMGARKMTFWPVGISLSLSVLSSVTVLGLPMEMYMFGSMYFWLTLSVPIALLAVTQLYIPFYYPLKLKSNFEYLRLRFNNMVRLTAVLAHIIQTVMYIGIMIYAPAVAITAVTTFNIWACILVIGLVCTLYTTLGGLKAVIWTDVFQGVVLIVGIYVILFMSAASDEVGSWENVWRANRESGRFDFFRFDMDPRYRHTFWTVVVGLSVFWTSIYATSQFQVQRYLCCKSQSEAQKAIMFGVVLIYLILLPLYILGWVMYAYFENCDPVILREVSAPDQLLPLMVIRVFKNQPGLPGLFIAALFAASLSTVSSGINALSSVTLQDFFQRFPWCRNKSERVYTWFSKALVLFYGCLCTGFACVSSQLGGVLQASLSVLGIVGGPLLGVFTLGIIFPCANAIGALVGFIIGLVLPVWLYIGSQAYPAAQYYPEYWRFKSRSISQCIPANFTPPVRGPSPERPAIVDDFYSLSYTYYTAYGFASTLLVGLIVSFIFYKKGDCKRLEPRLVRPIFDHIIFRCLPKSFRKKLWCGVQHDVQLPVEPISHTKRELPGDGIPIPEIIPRRSTGKVNKAYT